MADTTTELEVLDEIVEVLGGQSGQYETVVPTLQQILTLLGGGGGGGGYNPALSVGRADALTGADETAQWATRESTGTGSATVRSVQGASVVWNQLIAPRVGTATHNGVTFVVSADGSITANGTAEGSVAATSLVSVEVLSGHKYLFKGCPQGGSADTYGVVLTGSSSIIPANNWDYGAGNMVTAASDGAAILIAARVAVGYTANYLVFYPMLFDLTQMFGSGNEPSTVAEFEAMYPESYYPYSAPTLKPVRIAGIASADAQGGELDSVEWTAQTLRAAGNVRDMLYSDHVDVKVGERAYQSGDESDATVRTDGTTTYYPLATPTTTPISPALPMSYKVERGGTESIIVPTGEVSAAPVLTVAEGESAASLVMDALACIATPDGPTATANHAINTYLTMGGKLYKVTSAIAVGETITPNTNVTETTVMAELIARTA